MEITLPISTKLRRLRETDVLTTCTPITYVVEDVDTTVALLGSKEADVLAKTLSALCQKVSGDEKLVDFLIAKNVLSKIQLVLFEKKDVLLLRYSLKLLGLMIKDQENLKKLDEIVLLSCIPNLQRLYFMHKDDFIKEVSCLVLVRIVKTNPLLSVYICTKKSLRRIMYILRKSMDPDVLKNSLDFFFLLMKSDSFIEQLPKIKKKYLNILLCLLESQIDEIADVAMDILYSLSQMNVRGIPQKMANGETLTKMVSIITKQNKRYVEKANDIISNCVMNKQAAIYFSQTRGLYELLEFLKTCDNNNLLRIFPIFSTLSKFKSIKNKLYDLSAEETFIKFFKYKHEVIVFNLCKIITNLSMHKECCQRLLTLTVVETLVNILKNFQIDPYGTQAMKALRSFVKYDPSSFKLLYASRAAEEIQRIFLDDEKNYPAQFYEMIVDVTCAMVCFQPLKRIDAIQVCNKMLDLLRKQFPMKRELLKMMNMLMESPTFRKAFIDCCGPAYFLSTLQKDTFNDIYILNLDIIQNFIKYEEIAVEFLDLGTMSLLQSIIKKGSGKAFIYKGILDTLYDACLTIKFYDKRVLNGGDVVGNLFYLIQDHSPKPTETNFKPIYMVNIQCPFETDNEVTSDSISILSEETPKATVDTVVLKVLRNHSPGMRAILAHSLQEIDIEETFLIRDIYLEKYIVQLHGEIYSRTVPYVPYRKRIEKVAKFVNTQLSGSIPTDSDEEKLVIFQRHIHEIMDKLGHRFIPLGFLRMGYVLEKSLLFKVLCDHLAIPSTFRKEESGCYWNEVLIAEGQKELKKSYIVDFLTKIGRLIPRHSYVGNEYLKKQYLEVS